MKDSRRTVRIDFVQMFFQLNCMQGTLKESDWANELHPTAEGFQKIAAKYQEALETVFPNLANP